ncbi:M23 family metallopeptidase [Agaribacterium haliotis]|uniref:M23 family metallopeptidase n=1 Tax=Agaribacterium haliotis TaxID=2013869 RepID=UPI000BB53D28|nr:peptidoglycan DD-metalloendopeptidase family protein [Agaribacterium haliotis]
MRLIVVSKRYGSTRSINLGAWARAVLGVCLVGFPVGAGLMAWQLFAQQDNKLLDKQSRQAWVATLEQQQNQVEQAQREAEKTLAALTLRASELQARLVRLDALGERLTTMAKLDKGEFDFSQPPAVGGPEASANPGENPGPSLTDTLERLALQIDDRQQQLSTLEALLADRKLQSDVFLAGRPIKKGWMSSRYGRRTDPFTGGADWHAGVDFAAKENSDVVAVAAGVVTWSADRYQYGKMVEINHGNGFVTRYGHCKKLLVKAGDIVKKGQTIALVGSTGRSTGPHVHFEVHKNGRTVDPASYIHRASR